MQRIISLCLAGGLLASAARGEAQTGLTVVTYNLGSGNDCKQTRM